MQPLSCWCPGNYCSCAGGVPRLKDALADPLIIHLPLMLKDQAPAGGTMLLDSTKGHIMTDTPTKDTMPTATMTLDDSVKLPRYQGMAPGNARQYAARDLATVQDRRSTPDYRQGVYDAFKERLSNAWQADNDNPPHDRPLDI